MKINYINIQGEIFCGTSPKNLENLRKKANKSFKNLNIPEIYSTYQEERNAIAAVRKNEVIGWIDFEDKDDVQRINSIDIIPEYLNEGILENLITIATYELKNEKPAISIPVNMLRYFKPSIEKYGWEYTSYTVYSETKATKSYNEYTSEKQLSTQIKKQIKK